MKNRLLISSFLAISVALTACGKSAQEKLAEKQLRMIEQQKAAVEQVLADSKKRANEAHAAFEAQQKANAGKQNVYKSPFNQPKQ